MPKNTKITVDNLNDFADDALNEKLDGSGTFPDWDFLTPKFKTREQNDASGETTTLKTLESINVNHARLRTKLEKWGFFCQTIDKTRFFFRLNDNIIEEVTDEEIRDFMDDKIRKMPDVIHDGITKEMVENKFLSGNENLLRKTIINRLRPAKPIIYLEDTVDKAYFFYQNYIVEVSRAGLKTIEYKDNEKVVFKGSILKRDFIKLDKWDFEHGIYYQFLQNIADGHKTSDGKRQFDRFEEFKTAVGFLLHKFFQRKLKAIWWLDSRGDADAPKGRSGKGLIMKGCAHMLNADVFNDKVMVDIDGKELDQSQATKFEKAAINTKLIHLNDIEKHFKVTGIFNSILEGFKIRQMYKAPFTIQCKLAISSNYVPRTDSDSVRDRFLEIQTTDFYSSNFSPEQDFGKWFFSDDFTALDWQHFDNTMLHCVQMYFISGLKKVKDINLGSRKLQETTNSDFIDFMTWYETDRIGSSKIHTVTKEEFINDFTKMFPDYAKSITSRKITYWVRNYTTYRKDENGAEIFEAMTDENIDKYDVVIKEHQTNTAKRAFVFYKK